MITGSKNARMTASVDMERIIPMSEMIRKYLDTGEKQQLFEKLYLLNDNNEFSKGFPNLFTKQLIYLIYHTYVNDEGKISGIKETAEYQTPDVMYCFQDKTPMFIISDSNGAKKISLVLSEIEDVNIMEKSEENFIADILFKDNSYCMISVMSSSI